MEVSDDLLTWQDFGPALILRPRITPVTPLLSQTYSDSFDERAYNAMNKSGRRWDMLATKRLAETLNVKLNA